MKNLILIILFLGMILQSCNKEEEISELEPPINIEEEITNFVRFSVGNDSFNLQSTKCLNDDERFSSLISVANRVDSFGINRKTIICTTDSIGCFKSKSIAIGFDLKDKNENHPSTESTLESHLEALKNKSGENKLQVQYNDGRYTFQNYERIFNNSSQLYLYSENNQFDYEISNYEILERRSCGHGYRYFLVELEGSFSGTLFTTPNVVNRDSLNINCEKFKILILHDSNN